MRFEAELLEIKCSVHVNLLRSVYEYNKTGNFLDNRYFFKYFVQVQIQLACTGLDKGNLFFLIGNESINCVIVRDGAFITKIISFVKDYRFEFIDFIKSTNLELDKKKYRFKG